MIDLNKNVVGSKDRDGPLYDIKILYKDWMGYEVVFNTDLPGRGKVSFVGTVPGYSQFSEQPPTMEEALALAHKHYNLELDKQMTRNINDLTPPDARDLRVGDWVVVNNPNSVLFGKRAEVESFGESFVNLDVEGEGILEFTADEFRIATMDELPPEAWDRATRELKVAGQTPLMPPTRGQEVLRDIIKPKKAIDRQEGGSHYKNLAIQPVEYVLANQIGFCEGSVIKYVTRYSAKGGIEDLKKARHFLDLLIEDLKERGEG